jgi:hypothetical protein
MGYLVGNDGNVSFGTNYVVQFNIWNATFSRNVSDITGFGDYGRRRQLGVHDCSGSAGGFLRADVANSAPNLGGTAASATAVTDWLSVGSDITLTAKSGCTYGMKAVISDGAVSVAKTGDAAISFNFALSGGQIPVETWDES